MSVQDIGFDRVSFELDYARAFNAGFAKLRHCAHDPDGFIQAYHQMGVAMQNVVERWNAPQDVQDERQAMVEYEVIRLAKMSDLDLRKPFEPVFRKVCIELLRASGALDNKVIELDTFRFQRPLEARTVSLLVSGGLGYEQAKNTISCLAGLCDDVHLYVVNLDFLLQKAAASGNSNYKELFDFLKINGTEAAKAKAAKANDDLNAVLSKPSAKLFRLNDPDLGPLKGPGLTKARPRATYRGVA